jgi:hypothetical protein
MDFIEDYRAPQHFPWFASSRCRKSAGFFEISIKKSVFNRETHTARVLFRHGRQ